MMFGYTLRGNRVEILEGCTDAYLIRFEGGKVCWWPRELMRPSDYASRR